LPHRYGDLIHGNFHDADGAGAVQQTKAGCDLLIMWGRSRLLIISYFREIWLISLNNVRGVRIVQLRAGLPNVWSSSHGRGKMFPISVSSRPVMGSTQRPLQWVPGALFPVVKRQGRDVDHSPSTTAEAKNVWIYASNPYMSSWRNV
jgi:hypothetical protein